MRHIIKSIGLDLTIEVALTLQITSLDKLSSEMVGPITDIGYLHSYEFLVMFFTHNSPFYAIFEASDYVVDLCDHWPYENYKMLGPAGLGLISKETWLADDQERYKAKYALEQEMELATLTHLIKKYGLKIVTNTEEA